MEAPAYLPARLSACPPAHPPACSHPVLPVWLSVPCEQVGMRLVAPAWLWRLACWMRWRQQWGAFSTLCWQVMSSGLGRVGQWAWARKVCFMLLQSKPARRAVLAAAVICKGACIVLLQGHCSLRRCLLPVFLMPCLWLKPGCLPLAYTTRSTGCQGENRLQEPSTGSTAPDEQHGRHRGEGGGLGLAGIHEQQGSGEAPGGCAADCPPPQWVAWQDTFKPSSMLPKRCCI